MYTYTHVYTKQYIYIYIERERERERDISLCNYFPAHIISGIVHASYINRTLFPTHQ